MISKKTVFNHANKDAYIDFLNIANKCGANIDIDKYISDFYGDNLMYKKLLDRWCDSVYKGEPDFSVYGDESYVVEMFNCWKVCSKLYLSRLKKFVNGNKNMFAGIQRVLDLGCGNAYSTLALSDIFCGAEIIGTNVYGTLQYAIDEYICGLCDDCKMMPEDKTFDISGVDIIFASEFFEHLVEPIEFLEKLIFTYAPKYIIFRNEFSHMSIGHFIEYKYAGKYHNRSEMSRIFYNTLKINSYIKIETGFFSNSPMIYKKDDIVKPLF